jgi:hypothetical protein
MADVACADMSMFAAFIVAELTEYHTPRCEPARPRAVTDL